MMKTEIKKPAFNLLFLAVALITPLLPAAAQDGRYEKSFSGKEIVSVYHRYGPLVVLPARDGKVRYEVTISVEAQTKEEEQLVYKQFAVRESENGSQLTLKMGADVKNWNTNNGLTRIEFSDGTRVKNLRNLKINFLLFVPALQKLELENRYEEIQIQNDLEGSLQVRLYSGRIETGNIKGDLSIDAKYSKGKLGNFANGNLQLYDCNLVFGNGKKVSLRSKYSEVKLGDTDDLTIDSYDDNFNLGNVKSAFHLTDKYSEFNTGSLGNARLDLYDSDLVATGGNDIHIKSKYTEIKFDRLNSLRFEQSYDDNVEVTELGTLTADSKYTEFDIGTLKTKLSLISYDDNLEIDRVAGTLQSMAIESKYTEVSMDLPDDLKFQLEAIVKYGKLTFPEGRFEKLVHVEKNDQLDFKGRVKSAPENSPKISVQAYDSKISIN